MSDRLRLLEEIDARAEELRHRHDVQAMEGLALFYEIIATCQCALSDAVALKKRRRDVHTRLRRGAIDCATYALLSIEKLAEPSAG